MMRQTKALAIQMGIAEADRLKVYVTDEDTGVDLLEAPLHEMVANYYHSIAESEINADLRATAEALRALASDIEERLKNAETPTAVR